MKHNKFLLEEIFKFDNTINLQRLRSFSPFAAFSYFKYFFSLLKTIRRQKFDIVITTVEACLPDQYLLTYLSNAQQRIGPKYWRGTKNIYRFALTNQVTTSFEEHIINFHFDIVRSLNSNFDVDHYLNKTKEALIKSAEPSNIKLVTNKLLIVLPGSGSQPYKRWPFKNYLDVINNALENYNCDIAVISGHGEYDSRIITDKIMNNPRFHNLSDSLNLRQVIDLFLNANLIIANDNGLLHLAEFLDKPTIGLYPGNWTHVSKRYFDNDAKHIVLPKNQKDFLSEKLMKNIRRGKKVQELCAKVINSITVWDVINEINNSALLN
ncbi:MAG: lipopolysaccharide core biosynthesis protein [Elusimicrobia bacterium ADurb.Bin231]|nr:MAG: lipopolysaccharide core biosynthesis protein [Elusimicrobia bacterium ADurb.Bin231]